ncbi:phage tail spike protein, partial [Salmonella enterica]|uniref:phage tail spike protein n=1 Tax=Salmonella enterica TaxID=28901 RepID=UPI003F7F778B
MRNLDGTMIPRKNVVEFNEEEDPERLLEQTFQQLLTTARPKVSFSASVMNIGASNIGDTVTIHRYDLGIHYETRIRKVERDKLDDNRTSVELGDVVHSGQTKKQNQLSQTVQSVNDTVAQNTADISYTLDTANGKNSLTYGNVEPERKRTGDLWYRDHTSISGENQMLKWNGDARELVLDTSVTAQNTRDVKEARAQAQEAKNEAQKSYTNSVAYADDKVATETTEWNNKFDSK